MKLLNIIIAKTTKDLEMPELSASRVLTEGLTIALWGIGVLSVALIIYAAIRIITARGDVEKATKGRRMIIWGMVGLGIAVLAGTISSLVINTASGK